ncbi:MAG: hypothetical protein ACI8W3_001036 [Myxococcota bacterium]
MDDGSTESSTERCTEIVEQRDAALAGAKARLFALAVVVIAIALQLPTYDRAIVPMDEGHLAAVAGWLQTGKLLYRDLHTGVFPGIYHLTAVLFAIVGENLVVARIAEVCAITTIALCLWLVGVRTIGKGWAIVAPALYLALVPIAFPVLAMFNYSSLALTLSIVSFYLLVRLLDEGERGVAIALGTTLALAVFSKQNFGALTFIAVLIGLIANRKHSALAERSWAAILLPIAASGIAVTLCFVAYFVATGTLFDFLNATVIQLGGNQLESYNNPIPSVLGHLPVDDGRFIFMYSPPYLFNKMLHGEAILGTGIDEHLLSLTIRLSYGIPLAGLIGGVFVWWFDVGNQGVRDRRNTRITVLFALLFFLGIFPSAVWSHLAFILAPVLFLLGLLGARCDRALSIRKPSASTAFRATAAGLVGFASLLGMMASADIARWNPVPLDLPRGDVYVSQSQADIYRNASIFVEQCAEEDEAIFVAPYMPVVYFLTGKDNVSRYDLTIPGDVDGQLIIDSLEADQTRCIVYNPVMYPEFPPFRVLFPELDVYIKQHYRPATRIEGGDETWVGLVRKGSQGRGANGPSR